MSVFDAIGRTMLTPAMGIFMAEDAVYTPSGGSPVNTRAVVVRGGLVPKASSGDRHMAYKVQVHVPIEDVPTVTKNADTIAIKLRKGDAGTTTMTVAEVIGQDGGRWHLGVR